MLIAWLLLDKRFLELLLRGNDVGAGLVLACWLPSDRKQGFGTVAEHNRNRSDGSPRHVSREATRLNNDGP